MELSFFKNRKLPQEIILIGSIMILTGIIFIATSSVVTLSLTTTAGISSDSKIPMWLYSILSDIGTGLLATGLLTVTLEKSNQKRHQEDIQELKETYAESIIQGLIPQPFFEQIKADIMNNPFHRFNYHGTIQINWKEGTNKKFLTITDIFFYDVTNISRTNQNFEARIYEDKMYEVEFPNSTKIQEFRIDRITEEGKKLDIQSIDQNLIKEEVDHIEAIVPVKLDSKKTITVSQRLEYIRSSRDTYPYALSKPTCDLLLSVSHPDDLIVNSILMHGSFDSFVTNTSTATLKVYQIRTGILPYQGILLTWHPKTEE